MTVVQVGVVVSRKAFEKLTEFSPTLGEGYNISYFIYQDYSEAEAICRENENRIDVFVFGGRFLFTIIKDKSLFERKPCFCVPGISKAELYGLLLRLAVHEKIEDFSRTYIDCIDASNNFLELKDILPQKYFPQTFHYAYDEDLPKKLIATHLALWREGKIDRSITRSSMVARTLEAAGMTVHYLYPSREDVNETFQAVSNYFRIKHLENNLVTIGQVSLYQASSGSFVEGEFDMEMKQVSVHKALLEFFKTKAIMGTIQYHFPIYEIFISKGALAGITGHYTRCSLLAYLEEVLPFKVCIGWGIGDDMRTARRHAQSAIIEAEKKGGTGSFVVNESEHVIGPLSAGNCLEYENHASPLLDEISRRTKLSITTLQKVMAVIAKSGDKILSAADLAYYLAITERSASRILSKLVADGLAEIAYAKPEKLRGRPRSFYALNFQASDSGSR